MDRSVKIAAAASVLVGGILLALLFRHESPPAGQSAAGGGERLILRERMNPLPSGDAPADDGFEGGPARAAASGQPGDPSPTVVTPLKTGTPPNLSRNYPGNPTSAAWGTPMGLPPVASQDNSARSHKIVDGDSLANLAERYLGAAERAMEIYEANRDVLPSPAVLPIGAELKIPPREGPPGPALPPVDPIDPGRLVPIPRP